MAVLEAIQTQRVEAETVSQIEFTGIGTGYRHLQLRCSASIIDGNTEEGLKMRFQASSSWYTGNDYYTKSLGGRDGNTKDTLPHGLSSAMFIGTRAFSSELGNGSTLASYSTRASGWDYAATVVDIADYKNTTRHKTVRSMSLGWNAETRGVICVHSGIFLNTAAITGIRIYSESGANLERESVITLYGIKDS